MANDDLNQRLIHAKEQLARKRAALGLGTGLASAKDASRLPPGQHLVESKRDFPVLDLGIQPEIGLKEWRLELKGACEAPVILTWDQFTKLGVIELVTDFHCVTTWSTYDMPWRGVPLAKVIRLAMPSPKASHVMFHSYDGYTTNVPLEDCLADNALIATDWNGRPLEAKHGGPARGMIPHLYAWKSAKWVCGIEFLTQDQRGFWEVRGYHNYGDPFLEQRYSSQE